MRYYVIAECEDGDVMITPSDTKKDYFENWAMAQTAAELHEEYCKNIKILKVE